MKFTPSLEIVTELSKTGRYRICPVSCELLSDSFTPIEILRILKTLSGHCYLLESVEGKEKWGRYTFLGFEPKMEITYSGGILTAGGRKTETKDPAVQIRKILADYKSPRIEGLPPFTGGLVGYFAYDYFGDVEPAAHVDVDDSEDFRNLDLMLFDRVIAFDNFRQKLILITNIGIDNPESNYRKAVEELEELAKLLLKKRGEIPDEKGGKLAGEVVPLFSKEEYCSMVERAKHYIREGDIFQIVLSNRLSAPFDGSLLNAYRILRTINPSPYMFYLCGTDVEVAGASPETLVKLMDGVLHTFPLAGTRLEKGRTPRMKRWSGSFFQMKRSLQSTTRLLTSAGTTSAK